jgi:hypothetical protein
MKREFAFDDALRMLEVLWSSLPPLPPQKELQLFEKQFCSLTPGDAPILKTPRENAYTKVCALRRQSSAASLHSLVTTHPVVRQRQNQSLDETSSVKEQSKMKQFSSLDDASIQMMTRRQESRSRCVSSFEKLAEPESDETTLKNHIIDINTAHESDVHSGSTGNIIISKGGAKQYIKDLKEKFSGSQSNNPLSSVDTSNTQNMITDDAAEKEEVRVVKNLNEFLNFTALNKNRFLPDKIVPRTATEKDSSQVSQDNTLMNECNQTACSGNDCLPAGEQDTHSATFMCDDGSSPDDSTEYFPMTTSMTRELRLELENLDRQVFGSKFNEHSFILENSEELESPCSESFCSMDRRVERGYMGSTQDLDVHSDLPAAEEAEICPDPSSKPITLKLTDGWQEHDRNQTPKQLSDPVNVIGNVRIQQAVRHSSPGSTVGAGEEIFVWENPLQCPATPDEEADLEYDDTHSVTVNGGEIFENEGQGVKSVTPIRLLRSGVGGVQDKAVTNSAMLLPGDNPSDSSDGWGDCRGDARSSQTVPNERNVSSEKYNSDSGQLKQKANDEISCTVPSAMTNSCEEVREDTLRNSNACVSGSRQPPQCSSSQLPPPSEFGGGNPFLMFLCLTVLQQHRHVVMSSGMDYNEMAMHFDKMVRKHNVTRVLNQARHMFAAYLKKQASLNNNTVHPNSDLSV